MDAELALIRSGVISAEDYVEAISRREDERPRLGQVAIEEGALAARQVLDILTQQYAHPERRFGEIAIENGYLEPDQVQHLVVEQQQRQRPVLDHLVELGSLSPEEAELAAKERSGAFIPALA